MTEPIIDRDPGDEDVCPRPSCRGVLSWSTDGSSYCARCRTRFSRPGRLERLHRPA